MKHMWKSRLSYRKSEKPTVLQEFLKTYSVLGMLPDSLAQRALKQVLEHVSQLRLPIPSLLWGYWGSAVRGPEP